MTIYGELLNGKMQNVRVAERVYSNDLYNKTGMVCAVKDNGELGFYDTKTNKFYSAKEN